MRLLFFKNYLLLFFEKIYRKKKHPKFKEFEREVIFFKDNKIDNRVLIKYFEYRTWKDVSPETDENTLSGIILELKNFKKNDLKSLTNYYLAKKTTTV